MATIAAFVDRDTHHLAKFLIFRPSSPILLVSCLLLARTHLPPPKSDRTALNASVLCLALALVIPSYLKAGAEMVRRPATARLLSQMDNRQRDITRWISQQTPENAAILVEPSLSRQNSEADGFPLGLERLTGRGLIVFFKNVPSDTRDFVRWYKLLAASDAFFSGDCSQLSFLRADYVVVSSQFNLGAIGACTETVYQNEDYVVARTVRSP